MLPLHLCLAPGGWLGMPKGAYLLFSMWHLGKQKGRGIAISHGAFQPGEPGAGTSWHFASCKLSERRLCCPSGRRDRPEEPRASGSRWALPLDGLHSCLSHCLSSPSLPPSLPSSALFSPLSEFTSPAGMHIWSLSSPKSSSFFFFLLVSNL